MDFGANGMGVGREPLTAAPIGCWGDLDSVGDIVLLGNPSPQWGIEWMVKPWLATIDVCISRHRGSCEWS